MDASLDREGIADLQTVVAMREESEQFEEESEFCKGWFGTGWFGDGERNNDTGNNGEDGSADSTMDNSEEEFSLSAVACMALQLRV